MLHQTNELVLNFWSRFVCAVMAAVDTDKFVLRS